MFTGEIIKIRKKKTLNGVFLVIEQNHLLVTGYFITRFAQHCQSQFFRSQWFFCQFSCSIYKTSHFLAGGLTLWIEVTTNNADCIWPKFLSLLWFPKSEFKIISCAWCINIHQYNCLQGIELNKVFFHLTLKQPITNGSKQFIRHQKVV